MQYDSDTKPELLPVGRGLYVIGGVSDVYLVDLSEYLDSFSLPNTEEYRASTYAALSKRLHSEDQTLILLDEGAVFPSIRS